MDEIFNTTLERKGTKSYSTLDEDSDYDEVKLAI